MILLTSLLFECSDQVVPLLTTIVNQSLATGIVPSCKKSAVVAPLLETPLKKKTKKQTNKHTHKKKTHTWPKCIWTLQACFKCAFCVQIHWKKKKKIFMAIFFSFSRHRDHNNLWHAFQSAYCPKRSTETAPSCLKWLPDCFRLRPYFYSDSSGSKHCLRHNRS